MTSWTVACQARLSLEFSMQEYCRGLPFPSPGDLPNPGIKPGSPTLRADSLQFEPPGKPNKLFYTIFAFALLCGIIISIFQGAEY